jgi:hypothetical protein
VQFIVWDDSRGLGESRKLAAGRCALPIPAGSVRISLSACKVEGGPMDCRDASISLPHDGPLDFVVRRAVSVRLRVIASDTRADLADVEVVRGATFEYEDLEHPGGRAKTSIVSGARSPLDLPPLVERDGHCWVRSPGYAWQHVELDLARGMERLVELVPEGAIELSISGAALPPGAVLRGWRGGDGGAPALDLEVVDGERRRIDALTPGDWRFKLQKGRWFQEPVDLAESAVVVESGRTASVALVVRQSVEAPPRVAVSGVLRIDPAWRGLEQLRLHFTSEGDVRRWSDTRKSVKPVRNGSYYTWSAGELHAGRYMVRVAPSGFRTLLDVRVGAAGEHVIEVPPPGDVEVHVVDDATGEPLADGSVLWHTKAPPGVSGHTLDNVSFDPELGARFQAPAGELNLQASAEGYTHADERVEVQPGPNRFTLRIERASGVRVELYDGAVSVPHGGHRAFTIEAVDHDGRRSRFSDTWSYVSKPGVYRVTFRDVPGYRPLPPQVVTIPAGEIVTVRGNLERVE